MHHVWVRPIQRRCIDPTFASDIDFLCLRHGGSCLLGEQAGAHLFIGSRTRRTILLERQMAILEGAEAGLRLAGSGMGGDHGNFVDASPGDK
jgi:hypothetical protein